MTDTEFQDHPPVDLARLRYLIGEQAQDITELRQRVRELEHAQPRSERERIA